MDSVLDKVGLYDFLGVFLSGMLIIVISFYLDLTLINLVKNTDNETINTILFLLESYFLGLLFQEISSFLDKKLFKFREKARSNFLNDNNKIIDNKLELEAFKNLAHIILDIQDDNHIYSKSENEYVYYYCKTFLEIHEKSNKINRINSLYAMSRSLMVSLSLLLFLYLKKIKPVTPLFNCIFNLKTLSLIISILIFFKRTSRFSKYKVRVILRHYKILNKTNIE